jgi:hypothetical protein
LYFSYAACDDEDLFSPKDINLTEVKTGIATSCKQRVDEEQFGVADCRCQGIKGFDGSIDTGKGWSYEADAGSSCDAWDKHSNPGCKGDNPPAWCSAKWCFVDPCKCSQAIIGAPPQPVSFGGTLVHTRHPVYWSFATCGRKNLSIETTPVPDNVCHALNHSSKACRMIAGKFEDNWGEKFELSQQGCDVSFGYKGRAMTGNLDNATLQVHGWAPGAVQTDGDVVFQDGGVWKRVVPEGCDSLGATYMDNWGERFTIVQNGCNVTFRYQKATKQGVVSGRTLKVPGWKDGLVHDNGDVKFVDGGLWAQVTPQAHYNATEVQACGLLSGQYEDSWGQKFFVYQQGCSVSFAYQGNLKQGELSNRTLHVIGWTEGTLQESGDVIFADGARWKMRTRQACDTLAGPAYQDNWGNYITRVHQEGCTVTFQYRNVSMNGTLKGSALKVGSWAEGAVQESGAVWFADGGSWTKVPVEQAKAIVGGTTSTTSTTSAIPPSTPATTPTTKAPVAVVSTTTIGKMEHGGTGRHGHLSSTVACMMVFGAFPFF